MKRIIEIDEKDLERIREIVERENKTALEVTTRGVAYITIADSKPYEEKPQGEWSLSGFNGEGRNYYNCSVCGRLIEATRDELIKFPYCHCGADMRGAG